MGYTISSSYVFGGVAGRAYTFNQPPIVYTCEVCKKSSEHYVSLIVDNRFVYICSAECAKKLDSVLTEVLKDNE